jgi:hypothetical protein
MLLIRVWSGRAIIEPIGSYSEGWRRFSGDCREFELIVALGPTARECATSILSLEGWKQVQAA